MEDNLITTIVEALTSAQRRARGRQMKRLAPKIARKRKIALKKKASTDKLMSRAEKAAKEIIRKRIVKGKNYKDLPFAQREIVDKKVEQKKELIKKIAKKLLPQMRKNEVERLRKRNKE